LALAEAQMCCIMRFILIMQHIWASARANEVHSCVTQHVWASARTKEFFSCVSSRFGWAVYIHRSMFICE